MVTNWLAELDGRRVTVDVPASSANLGAGYDCLAVALGLTNRIEVEVRGWSRGQIELTVDGEGANELTADRENRCVLGVEAALREVRGEIPEGVGWRIEMRNDIPLARGLGLVRGGDGRRARRRQRAARRAADEPRPAPPRDGDRGPPGQRGGGAARRVHGRRPASTTASRRSGSTRRATSARCSSSRSCACRPTTCGSVLPDKVPRGRRGLEPHPGRGRRRRDRHRPVRPAPGPHRRPPPRAVPGEGVPAAAAVRRRRAGGGCDRGLPERRRLDDHRLHRHGRPASPASNRRSGPRPPTRTWPAGSRSSHRGTWARRSSRRRRCASPAGAVCGYGAVR